jgi:ATP-binding cassette subfamily B multidrug efflux pump
MKLEYGGCHLIFSLVYSSLMNSGLEKSLLGFIAYQIKRFWGYYLGAMVALFLTHLTSSYLPQLAKELAELVESGAENFKTSQFFWLALGIVVFRTSSRLLFFYPARVMEKDIRVDILNRLETTRPERYESFSSGQLFQALNADTEQMRALIGFALLQVGNIIVGLSVLIPRLMDYNKDLVIALIPMLLGTLFFGVITAKTRNYWRLGADAQGDVQNFIMESYAGKKSIKNYLAEGSFIKLFSSFSWKELFYAYKAGVGIGISMPLVPLGVGLSLVWGGFIIKDQALGASALIFFGGYVFLFLEPLAFLSWIGVVIVGSKASWDRIKKLMIATETPGKREMFLKNTHPLEIVEDSFTGAVEYWDKVLMLELKQKKWNVFIGKTGSGKSYVLNQLACLFYDKGMTHSLVGQSPYLYNDTLIKNIFLGKEATQEEIQAAYELLTLFGLDYLERSKERLLAMEVGEHGKRLSGGQAKRLCLVRSILSNAEVLLWDDPFSSVDVILEKEIITELKKSKWLDGKTVILCSHRLSTVRMCDELFFIDTEEGMLEKGSVESLLKTETKTYEYFEKQLV